MKNGNTEEKEEEEKKEKKDARVKRKANLAFSITRGAAAALLIAYLTADIVIKANFASANSRKTPTEWKNAVLTLPEDKYGYRDTLKAEYRYVDDRTIEYKAVATGEASFYSRYYHDEKPTGEVSDALMDAGKPLYTRKISTAESRSYFSVVYSWYSSLDIGDLSYYNLTRQPLFSFSKGEYARETAEEYESDKKCLADHAGLEARVKSYVSSQLADTNNALYSVEGFDWSTSETEEDYGPYVKG